VQTPDPQDSGKTLIRMKKTDMEELGIQNGEIVKLTGGKTTYAFCLEWNDNYDQQNEKNFVCLDASSKNIPIIKTSDLTYSNLQNRHFGNLVELEKSSAIKANKITIMPLYVLGTTEKKYYNIDWLEEQVIVSKDDHIRGIHDPKKIPGFFVIGGIPDSQAWIIDKHTTIEISDKIHANSYRMITDGGHLNSVIPVVQRIKGDDFEATISAIEVYDNCMKILMYVKDTIVHQEDWTSGLCTPTIKMWDDLGNQYRLNRYSGRGGATQFGDSLWTKPKNNFSEISCIMTPMLEKHAQELTLSIEQLLWDVRKHPMPQRATPVAKGQPIVMTPSSCLDEKFVIHGGPWELKIKLEEK